MSIVDPASGRQRFPMEVVAERFSGIALELQPTGAFVAADTRRRLRLRDLTGRIVGLRRGIVGILVLAGALEAIALVNPIVTQFVVDGALVTGDRDLLVLAVLGGATLLVIDFALRMMRGWIGLRINQQLALQWSANLFTHLLRLPMPFFEKRHLGDISSRFGSLAAIRSTLTNGTISAALDGVMALATLVLMTIYSARLAAVALAALASYAAIRGVAYRPFRAATEERIVLAARENSFFLESIRAALPLKLYGRVAERIARWQNLMIDVQNREVATQRMSLWFASASTLIAGTEGMVLLYLGGLAVLDRTMSLGMLLAFLAYRTQFAERSSKLIDLVVEVKMLGLHAERLADIALEPPEVEAAIDTDVGRIAPRLDVQALSFRYADGEPWVLRDCSFTIEAGESVAIVGASGCGKTTLLKLLLGLHAPSEGTIRIGAGDAAMPLAQLGTSAYRGLIGTVTQDDVLLSGSLADNIACFDVQADCARRRGGGATGRGARRHRGDADGLPDAGRGDGLVAVGRAEAARAAGPCAVQAAEDPRARRSDQPSRPRQRAQGQRGDPRARADAHHDRASTGDDRVGRAGHRAGRRSHRARRAAGDPTRSGLSRRKAPSRGRAGYRNAAARPSRSAIHRPGRRRGAEGPVDRGTTSCGCLGSAIGAAVRQRATFGVLRAPRRGHPNGLSRPQCGPGPPTADLSGFCGAPARRFTGARRVPRAIYRVPGSRYGSCQACGLKTTIGPSTFTSRPLTRRVDDVRRCPVRGRRRGAGR